MQSSQQMEDWKKQRRRERWGRQEGGTDQRDAGGTTPPPCPSFRPQSSGPRIEDMGFRYWSNTDMEFEFLHKKERPCLSQGNKAIHWQ